METRSSPRHLAAVVVADLAGYSRMVAADATDTLARVAAPSAGTVRRVRDRGLARNRAHPPLLCTATTLSRAGRLVP